MKKPTLPGESDDKRGLSQDFLKLQQQYHDATTEERERLWPGFIRAIRKTYPGFLEEYECAFRNGEHLKAMFEGCMKRVLARHDLDGGRKINAQEDEASFLFVFDELQRPDLKPNEMRELAFDLATRTLFTGLRAGLSLSEIEELRRQTVRDSALTAAKTPKKEGPRRAHAKKLACEIVKENPGFSYAEIVEAIPNRWRLENVACFTPRWLAELVPQWFPSRPKSARRRTYPLRRYRRF